VDLGSWTRWQARKTGARRGRLLGLEEVPPPEFFVSVASKAFSDPVSDLESIFAKGSVNIDFKEDTEVTDGGAF
jgi:hypothetical protein